MSLQSIRWCRGVSLQLIRLVNANDLIGCGGDPQPMRFIHGGVWRDVHHCLFLVITDCCPLQPLI